MLSPSPVLPIVPVPGTPSGPVLPPFRRPHEEDDIDLGEIVAILLVNRRLIAAVTAIVFVCGVAYAIAATPVFRADALVQVEERTQALGGLEELSSMFTGEAPAETEIEIIRSRAILAKVVDELSLDTSVRPQYFPVFGGFLARRHEDDGLANAPLGLARYAWGGEHLKIARLVVPAALEGETLQLVAGEGGRYTLFDPSGDVLVEGVIGQAATTPTTSPRRRAIQIFVSQLHARPGTHFRIVKTNRGEAVSAFQESLEVREKGKQTGIIQISLEGEDPERITEALDAVANAYVRQNVERMSEEAEKTLDFVSEQLPALKAALEGAERELNAYRSRTGKVDLQIEAQAIIDKNVEIERQLTELGLKSAEMKRRFTPQHPISLALQKQIEQLMAEKAVVDAQLKQLPEAELNNVRLTRDVQVANELYLLLLNKAQELKVVKSGTIGNVRILDVAALVQQKPVKPKKALVALMSLLGGAAMGTVLAFARKAVQRGVDDPDELEAKVGFPVYASLPHSTTQEASFKQFKRHHAQTIAPLVAVDPNDLAVEGLRSLRTSLQFALADSRNNVVAVGGPRPAVGKSFVSVNLALVIAQTGKKVLLIDGDMRRGHLHTYFGCGRAPGLADVLSGTAELLSAVRKTAHPNVELLSTGTLPPNPSELLLNPRFEAALKVASAAYDFVLIDTPPVLAVTDGVIVARAAGVNLLVLRAGLHPIREITAATSRLQQNGVRPNGFIFNDVAIRADGYSSGRYGYHYQYEYK